MSLSFGGIAGWCSELQNPLNTVTQGLCFHGLGKHSYDASLCGSVNVTDCKRHRKSKWMKMSR